jgi:hypothetical protein
MELDYNTVVEKTERMKQRWQKVLDNQQLLKIDSDKKLKKKFDLVTKRDKRKRKFREETVEELKFVATRHNERLETAKKRRDHIREEFERGLKSKEQHYNERMQMLMQSH